jgi:hypothetical protein
MRFLQFWLMGLIPAMAGCVIINPGDVQVATSPSPAVVATPRPSAARTAYGPTLERVLRQQGKVIDELQQRDWKDVLDEASDWTEQIRVLSGYAHATHDPVRFQAYCDRLLAQTQAIREAALRRDPVRCHGAIHGCDAVLDQLSREFPTHVGPTASPAPPYPPPVGASPGGARPAGSSNMTYVP